MLTTGDRRVSEIVERALRKRREERKKREAIKAAWRNLRDKGFGYTDEDRHAAILDYEKGRMLYDVMPDGAWKDQRCFIIGGGESLKNFDFSKLKNELVIGINRAYERIDCTINFSMDNNYYHWIVGGKMGEEAKRKFKDFKGIPVWLDSAGYDYPKGIFILNKSNGPSYSYAMKKGIGEGNNSGYGALNIAVCLGAKPIYLLGFDMKGGEDEKQAWWHDGYPETQSDKVYPAFANDFRKVALKLRKRGFQVINLNPESELRCFKSGEFEDIKPIKRPIIVSYYTKGTGYEAQVEHLKVTLRRFNLENDVVGIKDRGSWHMNTYYKAQFIARMMKKHVSRPIVYVDADAKMRMNPVLFNDLDCDFACHFREKRELLSGTLYFGDTKGARFLVNKWIEEDKLHPKTHMPQKNLRAVFDKNKDKIKWKALPVEYCMIYDSRYRHKISPVVEHFQLSRKYKSSDNKKRRDGSRMDQSLLKIQKFCKGKKMCILGNANSVLRKKRDIDSFDIVGRMNRGTPKGREAFIGSRTDILFLSTHMSGENIKGSFNPRHVVWMTICHRLASSWTLRHAIQSPMDDWSALYRKLRMNPTTGMMALNFVLKHLDFKSLDIYGFDFFKTKTWYNTKVDNGQKHSGEKEEVLFMKMIKGNPKVRFVS